MGIIDIVLVSIVNPVFDLVVFLVEPEVSSLDILRILYSGVKAVEREQILTGLDAASGQGVVGILVAHRHEVAVVVVLLVNHEVALVVIHVQGQEVLVTRDEHGVKVTQGVEVTTIGAAVGGSAGPAIYTIDDRVALRILGLEIGVGGGVVQVVSNHALLDGVTFLVIHVNPQLVVLIDGEVEDGVQRRYPVTGHLIHPVLFRVVSSRMSLSLEGDGVQADVGQELLVIIAISILSTVIGNPENQVGHRPVIRACQTRHREVMLEVVHATAVVDDVIRVTV